MPKKITPVSESFLRGAPVPPNTSSIPHTLILNAIKGELMMNGIKMIKTLYRATEHAKVAVGTLYGQYGSDPTLSVTYSFVNTYDKTQRFTGAIGIGIENSGVSVAKDAAMSVPRKFAGDATKEMERIVKEQFKNVKSYFDDQAQLKQVLSKSVVDNTIIGNIIGELFMLDLLGSDQLNVIKREMDSHQATIADPDNTWVLYTAIMESLQQSHPAKWMNQQLGIHSEFVTKFMPKNVPQPVIANISREVTGTDVLKPFPDFSGEPESEDSETNQETENTAVTASSAEESFPELPSVEELGENLDVAPPVIPNPPVQEEVPEGYILVTDSPDLVEGDTFFSGETEKIILKKEINGKKYWHFEDHIAEPSVITKESETLTQVEEELAKNKEYIFFAAETSPGLSPGDRYTTEEGVSYLVAHIENINGVDYYAIDSEFPILGKEEVSEELAKTDVEKTNDEEKLEEVDILVEETDSDPEKENAEDPEQNDVTPDVSDESDSDTRNKIANTLSQFYTDVDPGFTYVLEDGKYLVTLVTDESLTLPFGLVQNAEH